MRSIINSGIAVLGFLTIVGLGCSSKKVDPGEKPDLDSAYKPQPLVGVSVPKIGFTDITQKAGIRFTHNNGSFGKKLLPETMGAGVAFLDFDNDGHQDILFVNSCPWPGQPKNGQSTLILYRNKGDGTFEDVTEKAGLKVTMYGMGVACGDFDNDGWIDVFITGVGGNKLFRNEKGVFKDVTDSMQVGGGGGWSKAAAAGDFLKHLEPMTFSSSATFLDYDGDGKLDLFVCNYVVWSPAFDLNQDFKLTGVGRAFGKPQAFEGTTCYLYRNMGDHFEDVSEKVGIQVLDTEGVVEGARRRGAGKSLGVIVCDVDEDGWPDIVVANDTARNFFFHNVEGKNGERVFVEEGTLAGVAYAVSSNQARGAMGIDWGEYRPGLHALIIANFSNEPNTFLRLDNRARRSFQDVAMGEGIAGKSRAPLKFGAFFFDYDLDGRLDLLTCNGHLEPDIALVQPGQTYAQPPQLFWNTGLKTQRSFEEVTAKEAGGDLFKPMVGRGCAYADIDGNGSLDVVLTANGGTARLLRNNACDAQDRHHWVRLVLKGDGKKSNKSAIGARVEVKVGDTVLRREVLGARGYLSQSELPITIGLGKATRADRITIYWPGKNAGKQVIEGLAADKVHVVEQE
jgi:hypothetical protein